MSTVELISRLEQTKLVAIVNPHDIETRIDLIEILVDSGIKAIEILLRSDFAIDTLIKIRKQYPNILLGAGTVLRKKQYDDAVKAGADFTISAGMSTDLDNYTISGSIPHIPGIQTPTEIIQAQAKGFRLLKFFPAEPAGGPALLSDFETIFPEVRFMPSGSIKIENLPDYARIKGVVSVGGTWMYKSGGSIIVESKIQEVIQQSLKLISNQD